MLIPVRHLRHGDRIRGAGLTVDTVAVSSDGVVAHITGHVLRDSGAHQTASADLPADHRVRVVRPFEIGDVVTAWVDELDAEGGGSYVPFTVNGVFPPERQLELIPVGGPSHVRVTAGFRQARHLPPDVSVDMPVEDAVAGVTPIADEADEGHEPRVTAPEPS